MIATIHQGLPVLAYGDESELARALVILLHGRGATAESILPIAELLYTEKARFIIPQAALNRWYPQTAFDPLEANEPDLSSALATIDDLVTGAVEEGFSHQQIFLGGFSQGACLAAEYVARNARRYAGLFVLSGALIGPPGLPRNYPGRLDDMPIFIGGSDVDPWVALDFIKDTAKVFERMGANVDFRTYPGMDHTVNQDEINAVRDLISITIAD